MEARKPSEKPTGSLKCERCHGQFDHSINGNCNTCWQIVSHEWQAKMAIRMDPTQFDMKRLVALLLTQHWQHECEIIPAYMPPNPRPDTQPKCVIKHTDEKGRVSYLRHSRGPLQGFSWDVYGDDFHSPELALVALSQSFAPRCVDVVPTHGK